MIVPSATFAAAYARARAMRSGLLDAAAWQALAAVTDPRKFIRRLAGMGRVSDAGLQPEQAQHELHQGVIRDLQKLVRLLLEPIKGFCAFFMHTYDLRNLEVVISLLHRNDEEKRTVTLFDTGVCGMLPHAKLAAVDNFVALGKLLRGTCLARAFSEGVERYSKDDDLAAFLCHLEQEFVCRWRAAAATCEHLFPPPATRLFDHYILTRVVSASLRQNYCRRTDSSLARRWLESGLDRGRDECMRSLDRGEMAEAARLMLGSCLGADQAGELLAEPLDLTLLETRLQRLLLREAGRQQRRGDPGVGFLIAFFIQLQAQAHDLVTLMEARCLGAAPATVARSLLVA